MSIPVVIAGKGIPVRQVDANAPVLTVSENGLGAPIVLSDKGPPFIVFGAYDPDAEALFARMSVQPDVARKALYNDFIKSLKAAGVWPKLDCMYLMAAHDAQAARLNLVKDDHNAIAVNSPVFTTDRGYTTGGTAYLNSDFVPSTDGVNYTTNSAHVGAWTIGTNLTNTSIALGARDTSATRDLYLILRASGGSANQILGRMNQSGGSQTFAGTVTDSRGDTLLQRVDGTNNVVFKNADKRAQASTTSPTSNVPAFAIAIGGLNTNGTVGSIYGGQFAAVSFGGTFSDAEVLAFYNAKLAFLQAVGAV